MELPMSLLVVAYPKCAPRDRAWIQSIRERYDPHFELIAPHVTLVFPNDRIDAKLLGQHVGQVCQAFSAFRFVARTSIIVKDHFSPLTHLFLVPDEGFSQVVRLHDALYRGPLAADLILEVPFIPHITIGAFDAMSEAKAQADALNQASFSLACSITTISLIQDQGQEIRTLEQFRLAGFEAN